MAHRLRKLIVVIGGRYQGRNGRRWGNGSHNLFGKLLVEYEDRDDVVVLFRTWDADFQRVAQWANHEAGGKHFKTVVACYSHGVGRGLTELCRWWAQADWSVNHAVLCDPICYGSWFYMTWIWLTRSLWVPSYHLPYNIQQFDVLYQTRSRPKGHPVVHVGDSTRKSTIELDVGHTEADDSRAYHETVLHAAASV